MLCFLEISKLKTLKGLAIQDIITQVHLFTHRGCMVKFLITNYYQLFFYH